MKRTALLTFSALLMSSTALFAQERMRSPGYTGDVSDTQASTPEATATCENWDTGFQFLSCSRMPLPGTGGAMGQAYTLADGSRRILTEDPKASQSYDPVAAAARTGDDVLPVSTPAATPASGDRAAVSSAIASATATRGAGSAPVHAASEAPSASAEGEAGEGAPEDGAEVKSNIVAEEFVLPNVVATLPGRTEIMPVATGHLNRLETPFTRPMVRTSAQADAVNIQFDQNFVYVSVTAPVTLFIHDEGHPDPAIVLSLVPQRIAPRQVKVKGCKRPEDLLGDGGLMKELKIRLMERMLGAELTAHLGYEAGAEPPAEQTNRRNGVATKRVKGSDGEVPLAVPRDRECSFEPELVKKGQTRIDGVDHKIIGLYAAGLSVRDIQAHLEDLYGLRVSPDLISRVTDAVLDEVREWQHRALDRMYPIVIFDALRVKIRDGDSRMVKNKAVYIALGVTRDGEREVLGLWIADNEGAKFWLSAMNELRNRGVQDILIAVIDGLKGFPEAITAAFPETMVQTCIVHLIRHSMNFCSWKDRKAVAADLRPIYEAPTAEEAARQLDAFEEKWRAKYPSIAPAWRRAWAEVTPFYAFSAAIRKIIYTTNAVESLNRVLRKTLKTKGSFPTEEAATKLIFMAIRNFEKGGRAVREWVAARNQLAIMFAGRFDA